MPTPALTRRYGPGGLRAYPAAGAPPRIGAEEARTQKCPRCRKEYLSTINQRRCIASHLGASGGAKTARGVAGACRLLWMTVAGRGGETGVVLSAASASSSRWRGGSLCARLRAVLAAGKVHLLSN